MTVAANVSTFEYIGNDVTRAFEVKCRFIDASHLVAEVIAADGQVRVLTHGVDYAVEGGASDAGGHLTLKTALPTGQRLIITRSTPIVQQMNYATSDTFPAQSHERALDRAAMVDQEQARAIGDTQSRALLVPRGETALPLRAAALRAGTFLKFDPLGNLDYDTPENFAAPARAEAVRALAAAARAEALTGPTYANTAEGLAATTVGQYFAVDNGDGTISIWYHASGGVAANERRTATTAFIEAKFSEIVSVRDHQFGAIGDGVANDTAAFRAAVDYGGTIKVPAGTYLVDYIDGIDTPVNLLLDPGATIKQRIPVVANLAVFLDRNWGIFEFVPGSEGSRIQGGTIDGSRNVLAPYYRGHTRNGQDNHWWGVRSVFVNDFTLEDVTIINVMNEAAYFFGGERIRATNIKVSQCGVVFNAQGSNSYSSGWVLDFDARDIGNVVDGIAYYLFQHGAVAHQLEAPDITIRIKNYYGAKNILPVPSVPTNTGGGKEPVPLASSFYKLKRPRINVDVNGYSGSGTCTPVDFNAITGATINATTFDIEAGVTLSTVQDSTLHLDLDGNYRYDSGFTREGLLVSYGGVYDISAAGLAGETTAALATQNVTITGRVRRFGIGVVDRGDGITYAPGFDASGNVADGIQLLGSTGPSNPFPRYRTRPNGNRQLIGVKARFNGHSGVVYTHGTCDRMSMCDFRDNGQQAGARIAPYNVWVLAAVGQGRDLSIIDCDTDASTKTYDANGVTFQPGTATAVPSHYRYDGLVAHGYRYDFILRNPAIYGVGQFVKLNGVLAGGGNAVGKIIDMKGDVATLAFPSEYTFVSTYVLDTLSGTGSTTGPVLSGTGTNFVDELDFPVFVKNGSEYRRIAYVNSASEAIIDAAFSSPMISGALQIVRADIETGVYNPEYAHMVNENVVGPFLLKGNRHANITNIIHYLALAAMAKGAEFEVGYSLSMGGTALENNLVIGLPKHLQLVSVRTQFDTAITGITGNAAVHIKDNTEDIATAIASFPSFAAGTVGVGVTPQCPAFLTDLGTVSFVSSAGNPAGTLGARLLLRKY